MPYNPPGGANSVESIPSCRTGYPPPWAPVSAYSGIIDEKPGSAAECKAVPSVFIARRFLTLKE